MGGYEYYEFRAVERPLTKKELADLRRYARDADITPTKFVYEDWYEKFRADANVWMERYFDAFIRNTEWGDRELKVRVPSRFLDLGTARRYANGHASLAWEKDGNVILGFRLADEPEWEWEGELDELLPLRDELARGDLRPLYLAWLAAVQFEDEDESLEPPVPPGLGKLTKAQLALADFLDLDAAHLDVAAEASALLDEPGPAEVRAFISALAPTEKDELLARLLQDEGPELLRALRLRMERQTWRAEPTEPRRTVAQLVRAARALRDERARQEAAQEARARAERQRNEALERQKYLDGLAGHEEELWQKVLASIATKLPKSYDDAIRLLVDLRDLDARNGAGEFTARLRKLRNANPHKAALLRRLNQAGL